MSYMDSPNRAVYLRDIIARIEKEEQVEKPLHHITEFIKNWAEEELAYSIVGGFNEREVDHAA